MIKLKMSPAKNNELSRGRDAFRRASFFAFFLSAVSLLAFSLPLYSQTELGSEDDLTVLGASGTALDPDTEIKGFSVFGSTQAAYTGAVVGPGNVVVNGVLAVSSGAYFVGNSTFTGGTYLTGVASFTNVGNIYITGGNNNEVLSKNGNAGPLKWTAISALGDNLGDHNATQRLNMGNYAVWSSSAITAARYQINGSTVLAVLSGGSLGVGLGAGRINTSGNDAFVGNYAGYSNTSGGNNVFVGNNAGYSNTSGGNNSFFGNYAGYDNTSDGNNSFFGNWAGKKNTGPGGDNSFFGNYAGGNNTAGYYNTIMGSYAGYSNTLGNFNSFLGQGAGYYNTTGDKNSFYGYNSGYNNVTGSANAIFGNEAGRGTSGSFSSTTLMGYQAGNRLATGSADNIFVGFKAGYAVTTGTGNIVIGYNQDASAIGANNELNIGGVLYGDLSAKTIGISTRVPQAALDIVSTGTAHTQFAQIWRDGGGTIKSSMSATGVMMAVKFVGDGTGLTGVSGSDNLGNHTATQDLNLATFDLVNVGSITTSLGTAAVPAYSFTGNPDTGMYADSYLKFSLDGTLNFLINYTGPYSLKTHQFTGGGPSGANLAMTSGAWGNAGLFFPVTGELGFSSSGMESMRINAAGAVGIGTSTPKAMLNVVSSGTAATQMAQVWGNSSGAIVSSMSATGVMMAVKFVGDGSGMTGVGDNMGNHTATQNLIMTGYNVTGARYVTASSAALSGQLVVYGTTTLAGTMLAVNGTSSFFDDITIAAGKKLGIGVVPGAYDLKTGIGEFTGSVYTPGVASLSSPLLLATNGYAYPVLIGNSWATFATNGNVGISTGAPQARLDVLAGGSAPADMATIWRNSAGTIVSSMSATGYLKAVKFIGDGSGMTGVGDNLGNHTATANLTMTGYNVANARYVTASSAALSGQLIVYGTSTLRGNTAIAGTLGVAADNYNFRLANSANSLGYNMGRSASDGLLYMYGDQSGFTGYSFGGVDGERMRINSSGYVGISTGAPQARLDVLAGGSAQTDMGQIWRDGGGAIKSSMSATGVMMAVKFVGDGSGLTSVPGNDNLGNHTATQNLKMGANWISNDGGASEGLQFDASGNGQFSGNLGLGVAPGSTRLAIQGTDISLAIGDTNGAGAPPSGIQFMDTGNKHVALKFDGNRLIYENASTSQLPSTWRDGRFYNT